MDRTSTELKHLKTDDSIVIPVEQWREYQTRLKDLEDVLRKMDEKYGEALRRLHAWEDAYRKLYAYHLQDWVSPERAVIIDCLKHLKQMRDEELLSQEE